MAEVVEKVVAVPAGTQATDLHKPRPHSAGRGGDGDRPGRLELGVRQDRVAGKRAADFG